MKLHRRTFLKALSALALHLSGAPGRAAGRALASLAPEPDGGGFSSLLAAFSNPPDSSRPGGYWWWFNTLMNRAGITRDLEEFRAQGIGEVLLVNSQAGLGGHPIPHGPPFLSGEWFDLYRFALAEAHRLGIRVGFNLCAGWCMGGPWIRPEESGRWFLQSKITVTGPRRFSEKLPLPGNRDGYNDVRNPPGVAEYIDLPLEKLDYRDTAVIAFRLPESGRAKLSGERLALLPAKSNRMDASNWTRASVIMDKPLRRWANEKDDAPVPPEAVVDLTAKMGSDGHLEWDVPEGEWVIVRTGHRMTGSKTMLALPGTEGLSIDWLSRRGVDSQFRHLGEPILEASKPYVGTTLVYFCDDSFEDGFPNWTEDILERFRQYRGYDPLPYLAVLAGYIVGSAEISDRFLHDYRRTVADCMADEHYRRFAELCHANGLKVQNEAAGPSRSGTMCMDGLKNLGRSDFPMGEFWLGTEYGGENEENASLGYGKTRLEDGQNKVTKMTASAAHVYGRRLASAEAFTSFRPHWIDTPHTLKYAADRAFCEGINRFIIHTTTGSRPEDGKPGYEYGAGTHFNPNVTWWNQSGAFLRYLARCQHLLREGLFVADVLYYNGDWAPNLVPARHLNPSLGRGYDYDVCNEEVLLTRLAVRDGRLVLPDGMSYRILVLPDTDRMPVAVLRKIRDLVREGAVVVGPPPDRDSGLRDYPACDREVRRLAKEVWGDCDGHLVTSHRYGRGRVFWGIPQREVLQECGVPPAFEVEDETAAVDFIQRSSDVAEIFYLLNRKKKAQRSVCTFRVEGRRPWLLDPVTGESRPLPDHEPRGERTAVPLEFLPREAYFIVFPRVESARQDGADSASARRGNFPRFRPLLTLEGRWTVRFDPKWGGPESAEFDALTDWSTHPDAGIRHYSGTATYVKTFDAPAGAGRAEGVEGAASLVLDLGTVHSIADVRLNGRLLGTVWTSPWRIRLPEGLKPEGNDLEIAVTNTWPNRLIGDAALPPEKRFTNTNIEFKPDTPLQPAGLLGPVTVMAEM